MDNFEWASTEKAFFFLHNGIVTTSTLTSIPQVSDLGLFTFRMFYSCQLVLHWHAAKLRVS